MGKRWIVGSIARSGVGDLHNEGPRNISQEAACGRDQRANRTAMGAWTPPAIAANEEQMIEEIVVTATRRSESIQAVPINISAVTGQRSSSRV